MIPKYRAWYQGQMYFVAELEFDDAGVSFVALVNADGEYTYEGNASLPFELLQYIGRNDKNGKEIYKSDIVRLGYSDGSVYEKPVEVKFGLHRVGFDSDVCLGATALGFYFSPYPGTEDDDSEVPMGIGEAFDWDNDHIEVIGNIYEHPNLLED